MYYSINPLNISLILLLLVSSCDSKKEEISVSELKIEYLSNPTGLDVSSPRFSWIIENPGQRGTSQTAYQIILFENKKDEVEKEEGSFWNTVFFMPFGFYAEYRPPVRMAQWCML